MTGWEKEKTKGEKKAEARRAKRHRDKAAGKGDKYRHTRTAGGVLKRKASRRERRARNKEERRVAAAARAEDGTTGSE